MRESARARERERESEREREREREGERDAVSFSLALALALAPSLSPSPSPSLPLSLPHPHPTPPSLSLSFPLRDLVFLSRVPQLSLPSCPQPCSRSCSLPPVLLGRHSGPDTSRCENLPPSQHTSTTVQCLSIKQRRTLYLHTRVTARAPSPP
jgi:hypothetical protein